MNEELICISPAVNQRTHHRQKDPIVNINKADAIVETDQVCRTFPQCIAGKHFSVIHESEGMAPPATFISYHYATPLDAFDAYAIFMFRQNSCTHSIHWLPPRIFHNSNRA